MFRNMNQPESTTKAPAEMVAGVGGVWFTSEYLGISKKVKNSGKYREQGGQEGVFSVDILPKLVSRDF